jgi:hypothetical protein
MSRALESTGIKYRRFGASLFEFRPIFEDSDLLKTIARMEGVHPPTGRVSTDGPWDLGERRPEPTLRIMLRAPDHDSLFSYAFRAYDFPLRSTPATRESKREVDSFQ